MNCCSSNEITRRLKKCAEACKELHERELACAGAQHDLSDEPRDQSHLNQRMYQGRTRPDEVT